MVAGKAAYADLSAESYDAPGVAATWVWFAHLDDIVEVNVERWDRHGFLHEALQRAVGGLCYRPVKGLWV